MLLLTRLFFSVSPVFHGYLPVFISVPLVSLSLFGWLSLRLRIRSFISLGVGLSIYLCLPSFPSIDLSINLVIYHPPSSPLPFLLL